MAAVLEVEKQQRTIQPVEAVDEIPEDGEQLVRLMVHGSVRYLLVAKPERHMMFSVPVDASNVGNRNVQGDPVHPRGKRPLMIVARPGLPKAGGDFLGEFGAVI